LARCGTDRIEAAGAALQLELQAFPDVIRPYETFFHRDERNPILTAADWPYPVHGVQRRRDLAGGRDDAAALQSRGPDRLVASLRGALGKSTDG
jgi:hypothetical protein